jgi:hypothetical protein
MNLKLCQRIKNLVKSKKMKKVILFCLVLLSGKCFAQEFNKSFLGGIVDRLSFGVKAGTNYGNFTNASFATDPMLGFHAGPSVSFRMSNHFSVVEDFLFSMEGAKNKSTLFGGQDIKLYYVAVPVVFRYKTNMGLFIEAGTQTSIKVHEEVAGLTNGSFAKNMNMGAVGGIGYLSKTGLGVTARYVYGLTKVNNFSDPAISKDFKSYTAQVSLFYNF